MAQDKVSGSRVSKFYDRDAIPGVKFDAATQLGVVKDNLSPARDGRLRVWIPDFGGDENNEQFWRKVSYATPYAGSTYQTNTGQNNSFAEVAHSYGMWMTPPDIGNLVLCTFVNGDPERGFWFACVPSGLSRWMTPAVAGSREVDTASASTGIKASILPANHVPPQFLPVAEFNENIEKNYNGTFYNNKKPIHEFQANILFRQGLDRDPVRGAISSSSQRETPSQVFGISTPGRALTKDPADDAAYQDKANSGNIADDQFKIPTRKGGHVFVMDDGDVTGANQLVRLRTAGGHQILMHDSKNTLYVGHKDGTSWVEIDETGIKIYTAGDMSVRSEGVLNFHSDKDINMNAAGNFNINAQTSFNVTSAAINLGGIEKTLIYGAKLSLGGGQLVASSDGTLAISSGGAMTVSGSTIDINGGSGGNSISCPVLQKNKLADTTFDSDVTRLWYSVPQSVDSVVTILPSHEPWTRTGSAAPTTKSVTSSVCAPKSAAPSAYVLPPANNRGVDKGTVAGQPVPWSSDTAFITKVQSVAQSLNCNYIDLLACMANETGATFDPALVNSIGATGLIQFMPTTATGLGTSTEALRKLSRVDQLDWVLNFFNYMRLTNKAPTPTLTDLYNCIFWPAAVGKPGNYIIAPAGSRVAQQNASLRASDGSITVDSVGAAAAKWLPTVQQALANAGSNLAQSSGVVTSSSGAVVTDGSGNPVRTGTAAPTSTDQGLTAAAGKSIVGRTCPGEALANTATFSPSNGIGDKTPKLDQLQVKAMMAELAYFESNNNYKEISKNGTRIGKYQVDAAYLAKAGYIKPDAIKQYGDATLANNNSWTGGGGIQSQQDFLNNQAVQDSIQFSEFQSNYVTLTNNQGVKPTDDVCTLAGMLFVAHQFRDADVAVKWRNFNTGTDALGQTGDVYFNQGRYAIDVLAAGGAVATVTATNLAGENTTGINPDDVFVFSGTTGSRSNFDQLDTTFKNAILRMAQDFKAKTGSKITITSAYRSPADQDAIYQRWLAAGGGPNNPTAGGITTPAKPSSQGGKGSPHNSGAAFDSGQCPLISRTVDLSSYGLRWGGTFTRPDAVHIQLANANQ